jgi:hypothetical protein
MTGVPFLPVADEPRAKSFLGRRGRALLAIGQELLEFLLQPSGDRHSQYDLWPNPLADGEAFKGRTFIVVDGDEDVLRKAFRTVEPVEVVDYRERGQPLSRWWVRVCRGYTGRVPPKTGADHF